MDPSTRVLRSSSLPNNLDDLSSQEGEKTKPIRSSITEAALNTISSHSSQATSTPSSSLSDNITTQKVTSYITPDNFTTENTKCISVTRAQQDIDCYHVLFQDGGESTNWWTGFSSSEKSEDTIYRMRKKEDKGLYNLPITYKNYNIHSEETGLLIGRICFGPYLKESRLELSIYLISSARKKGLGSEIMRGLIDTVIKPGLGKPFHTLIPDRSGYFPADESALTLHRSFKGVFAKCDSCYNYPSLSLFCTAGYKIQWFQGIPLMFYPAGEFSFLGDRHVELLKRMTKEFFFIAQLIKSINPTIDSSTIKINIPKIIKESEEPDEFESILTDILQTKEPYSLMSAIDLSVNIGKSLKELVSKITKVQAANLQARLIFHSSSFDQSIVHTNANLFSRYKDFIRSINSKEEAPSEPDSKKAKKETKEKKEEGD